jgi:hypothetical protein
MNDYWHLVWCRLVGYPVPCIGWTDFFSYCTAMDFALASVHACAYSVGHGECIAVARQPMGPKFAAAAPRGAWNRQQPVWRGISMNLSSSGQVDGRDPVFLLTARVS